MNVSGRQRRTSHLAELISLLTGKPPDPIATRAIGMQLEIVPEADPTQSGNGPFTAKVLWQGKPLAGLLVQARNWGTPKHVLPLRGDGQGRITLPLDQGGVWLILGVWMVRGGWFDADDWHSHWAPLTLLRPEPT